MTVKQAISLGLLCGVALGAAACVGVLVWTGERLTDARARAYDEGLERARAQEVAKREKVSGRFNEALLDENRRLMLKIEAAEEALTKLADRADLPADAQAAISDTLEVLK
jgi:hypothetical protein